MIIITADICSHSNCSLSKCPKVWQLHYNLDITYLFVPAEEQNYNDTKSPVRILQPYNEPLVCKAAVEDAVGGVKKIKLQLAIQDMSNSFQLILGLESWIKQSI